jgi:hypothetical protein
VKRRNYVLAAFFVAVAIAVRVHPPGPIRFAAFTAADFTQQLTPLFLVSLLIERALEIFLTTWRGPGAAVLQATVDHAQAGLANPPTADQQTALQVAKQAVSLYSAKTQQIAMPIALVLGVLISAMGVRTLGNFVPAGAFPSYGQQAWFTVADVIMTGALVGGGSDFIHQFITTVTNFLNQKG